MSYDANVPGPVPGRAAYLAKNVTTSEVEVDSDAHLPTQGLRERFDSDSESIALRHTIWSRWQATEAR